MEKKSLELFRWDSNPFTFRILPQFFVGYERERSTLVNGMNNGSKFSLLIGPTGSGKTTFLKHLERVFDNRKVIYLPKPPNDPKDWVTVFNPILKSRLPLFRKNGATIYSLSEEVNRKLGDRKCMLFVDECHEASQESLEWLRTITDQIDNLHIVLAGLPVFENYLHANLETFMKRFSTVVKLSNLTKPEMRELIKRRVEGAGGDDVKPFTGGAIDHIFSRTGGFPREVLKLCDGLIHKALEQGVSTVDSDLIKDARPEEERIPLETVDTLPDRQRLIMEALSEKELTPGEIIKKMKTEDYKNKDNAVRSVNNILRRLMKDGLVERKKIGKSYKYKVSGRFQSVMVSA